MEYKMKLLRNLGRFELQKLSLIVIVGCLLLLSPAILTVTKPRVDSFSSRIKNMTLVESSCREATTTNASLAGAKQRAERRHDSKLESRPTCDFSGPRSIVCEMAGDVRIHGNSSSVTWISTASNTHQTNESWQIKPYARKGDRAALSSVRELSLRSTNIQSEAHHCTKNHSVPAIIFSTGGYAGNLFHDFSDMLIPLFLTSRQYKGEVRFLITNMKSWWINRHQQMLAHLSRYEVIDFDNDDDAVHCFPRVTVGLRCHREFNVDPSRPPAGYSMANLTQFVRSSYSLERETITEGSAGSRKPRLLIISRKWTRAFTNTDRIVEMGEGLGYEVVVREPKLGMDMAQFARIVNSCEVMMGVHGAGLANMVFLPRDAVLVQVVPWGRLEGIARYDFGWPASNAGLKYLQYEIGLDESSLAEQYPSDHPIIKDPLLIHKQGWSAVRDTFLCKQNIRLDVRRFKDVLLEAMKHIRQ